MLRGTFQERLTVYREVAGITIAWFALEAALGFDLSKVTPMGVWQWLGLSVPFLLPYLVVACVAWEVNLSAILGIRAEKGPNREYGTGETSLEQGGLQLSDVIQTDLRAAGLTKAHLVHNHIAMRPDVPVSQLKEMVEETPEQTIFPVVTEEQQQLGFFVADDVEFCLNHCSQVPIREAVHVALIDRGVTRAQDSTSRVALGQRLTTIRKKMRSTGLPSFPVVDEDDKFVGMIDSTALGVQAPYKENP